MVAGCQGTETGRLHVQEQPGLKRVDSGREIGRTHSHPTRHAEVDGIRLVNAPMATHVFPKWQGSHVGLEAIETFLASLTPLSSLYFSMGLWNSPGCSSLGQHMSKQFVLRARGVCKSVTSPGIIKTSSSKQEALK